MSGKKLPLQGSPVKWRLSSFCGGLMIWNFAMSCKGTFLVNHCVSITCLELLGAIHSTGFYLALHYFTQVL